MESFNIMQKVPKNLVSNLLCNALEGGSNYWYMIESQKQPISGNYYQDEIRPEKGGLWTHEIPLNPDGALFISDAKADAPTLKEPVKLYVATIIKGLEIMAEKYPKHFGDMMGENDDATTADVFLQCCIFGEVVYG